MTTPKLYLDACCLIEALKGRAGKSVQHPSEADMTERILQAGRAGELKLFTSTLSVAEVIHLGDNPPGDEEQKLIERLLMSGRDGITLVDPSPVIVRRARDLSWGHGLRERAADRIHVASALHIKAQELLTLDGRLANRFNVTEIDGCKLIAATKTELLPEKYRTDDLFEVQD